MNGAGANDKRRFRRRRPGSARWCVGLAIGVCALLATAGAGPAPAPDTGGGSIRATLDADEPVLKASAIQTRHQADGVYESACDGLVEAEGVRFDALAVPGRYRLKFETASGTLEGWDATVPPSDYEEEQPLGPGAIHTILAKTARNSSARYFDEVVVLDIQGNIQHAAILVSFLRKRPFVSAVYRPGEWTWRVERWEWEDPQEQTWTLVQERPYHALVRTRFFPPDYAALRTTYARHLGGIELTKQRPTADLGRIRLPRPRPGTHAIGPDGAVLTPFVVRPWSVAADADAPALEQGDTP